MKGNEYQPMMTDQLPGAVTEMSHCKCRTGCTTMRCKCYKNQLECTEICMCANCKNNSDEPDKFWNDHEETDGIFYFSILLEPLRVQRYLTHFKPMLHFSTPTNIRRPEVF